MKGWHCPVNPDLVFPKEVGKWRPSLTDVAKSNPEADPYRFRVRKFGSYVKSMGTGPKPVPRGASSPPVFAQGERGS
eukprot:335730-Alexandrium_andersonii.AAC.1